MCLFASKRAALIETNLKLGFSKLAQDPVVKSANKDSFHNLNSFDRNLQSINSNILIPGLLNVNNQNITPQQSINTYNTSSQSLVLQNNQSNIKLPIERPDKIKNGTMLSRSRSISPRPTRPTSTNVSQLVSNNVNSRTTNNRSSEPLPFRQNLVPTPQPTKGPSKIETPRNNIKPQNNTVLQNNINQKSSQQTNVLKTKIIPTKIIKNQLQNRINKQHNKIHPALLRRMSVLQRK